MSCAVSGNCEIAFTNVGGATSALSSYTHAQIRDARASLRIRNDIKLIAIFPVQKLHIH